MSTPPQQRFRIDWVLVDELAIGPAPRAPRHLDRLSEAGIQAVFSPVVKMRRLHHQIFNALAHQRLVLPDHRSGRLPRGSELEAALQLLLNLHQQHGAVFVHCVAAMERSPLVCLGWLVKQHHLTPARALDYLMQVHPGTNPLPGQLALLHELV